MRCQESGPQTTECQATASARSMESVFSRRATSIRLDVASFFMMGIDPQRYPPYRQSAFQETYRKLDHTQPSENVRPHPRDGA